MDKITLSSNELSAFITNAVRTELDEREKKEVVSKLVSRKAAAKRLGVDVSTLWRWQKSSYLKIVRIGRSVWVSETELRRIERGEREI